jgi:hypothetical protein
MKTIKFDNYIFHLEYRNHPNFRSARFRCFMQNPKENVFNKEKDLFDYLKQNNILEKFICSLMYDNYFVDTKQKISYDKI